MMKRRWGCSLPSPQDPPKREVHRIVESLWGKYQSPAPPRHGTLSSMLQCSEADERWFIVCLEATEWGDLRKLMFHQSALLRGETALVQTPQRVPHRVPMSISASPQIMSPPPRPSALSSQFASSPKPHSQLQQQALGSAISISQSQEAPEPSSQQVTATTTIALRTFSAEASSLLSEEQYQRSLLKETESESRMIVLQSFFGVLWLILRGTFKQEKRSSGVKAGDIDRLPTLRSTPAQRGDPIVAPNTMLHSQPHSNFAVEGTMGTSLDRALQADNSASRKRAVQQQQLGLPEELQVRQAENSMQLHATTNSDIHEEIASLRVLLAEATSKRDEAQEECTRQQDVAAQLAASREAFQAEQEKCAAERDEAQKTESIMRKEVVRLLGENRRQKESSELKTRQFVQRHEEMWQLESQWASSRLFLVSSQVAEWHELMILSMRDSSRLAQRNASSPKGTLGGEHVVRKLAVKTPPASGSVVSVAALCEAETRERTFMEALFFEELHRCRCAFVNPGQFVTKPPFVSHARHAPTSYPVQTFCAELSQTEDTYRRELGRLQQSQFAQIASIFKRLAPV